MPPSFEGLGTACVPPDDDWSKGYVYRMMTPLQYYFKMVNRSPAEVGVLLELTHTRVNSISVSIMDMFAMHVCLYICVYIGRDMLKRTDILLVVVTLVHTG